MKISPVAQYLQDVIKPDKEKLQDWHHKLTLILNSGKLPLEVGQAVVKIYNKLASKIKSL